MTPFALLLALAASPAHGPDVASMNKAVAPGDDFFAYANGAWLEATPIPADRASWGVDAVLADEVRKRTVELIQQAADGGVGDEAHKVGDFYGAYMDEAAIERRGLAPLEAERKAIAGITDRAALSRALGASLRADVDPLNSTDFQTPHLFGFWASQGLDDPDHVFPYLLQGGLGMPDREYYLSDKPQMAALRTTWQAHVVTVLKLAGEKEPEAKAARIVALEKKIAAAHAPRVESEDVANVQSWKREELSTKAPGLDWTVFLDAAGLSKQPRFFVWHPKATTGLSALVASESLVAWKDWLTFHAIEDASAVLPKAFADERFAFYGKALSGVPQQRDRWKRAVDTTSSALGEAVGKLYVTRWFPPAARAKAQAMVADIVKAFGKRIDGLAWMSPATRAKAKEKVGTLKVSVGYPDTWRDYGKLEIKRDDAFGNVFRASLFEHQRSLAKLGKAPDRAEWCMNAQEVNAVNLPLQNAIDFPAAILQPPYFDPEGDAAENYGAIGATIGHEISHSFDDQGAAFDAKGRLANWWTKEDHEHFEAAAGRLAAQFDTYQPFPDLHLNGKQTLSENIADVAGLAAAFDAYRAASGGKPGPTIGGFTGDQRFFIAFAQSWREKQRDEALRQAVITDGHAPPRYRAQTVRNLDAWYAAFAVKPAQKLFLAPADRVRIW